jgi:hypothetical protein
VDEFFHVLNKDHRAEAMFSFCVRDCIGRDQVREIAWNNGTMDFIPRIVDSCHERPVTRTNDVKRTCYFECSTEGSVWEEFAGMIGFDESGIDGSGAHGWGRIES